MPQKKGADGVRSPEVKVTFDWMLENLSLLYIGCSVLILLDRSYQSRFWTMFEAWLAFRCVTPDGLSTTTHETRGRVHIEMIYDAPASLAHALEEDWGAMYNINEAHARLASPDVSVTNQKDKDVQLEKVIEISRFEPQSSLAASLTLLCFTCVSSSSSTSARSELQSPANRSAEGRPHAR